MAPIFFCSAGYNVSSAVVVLWRDLNPNVTDRIQIERHRLHHRLVGNEYLNSFRTKTAGNQIGLHQGSAPDQRDQIHLQLIFRQWSKFIFVARGGWNLRSWRRRWRWDQRGLVYHAYHRVIGVFSTAIGTGFHGICATSSPVTREMFRQEFTGLLHPVDDAGREF